MNSRIRENEGNIELQSFDSKNIEEGKYEADVLLEGKEVPEVEENKKKEFVAASSGTKCCDKPYKRCLWIVIPLLLFIVFFILFLFFYVVHPLLHAENPTMTMGDVTISGLTLGGVFGGTRVVTLKANVDMTNSNPFDVYLTPANLKLHYPTLDGPVIGTIKMPTTIIKAGATETVESQSRLVDFPPPGDETVSLLISTGLRGEPLTIYSVGNTVAYAQVKVFNWYAESQSEVSCELKTYLTEPSKDSQVCTYVETAPIELKQQRPSEFQ